MSLSAKTVSYALGLLLLNLLQTANGQIIGDNYYRAFTEQKVNWYRAFQRCALLGMQLAYIEKESDLTQLKNSLFSQSILTNNYWVAGNNLASKGEYVWLTSGNKFAYNKWAVNQPGTSANRCVRTNYNFEWVTDACNNLNYFICSKPLVSHCGAYGGCSNGVNYLYEY